MPRGTRGPRERQPAGADTLPEDRLGADAYSSISGRGFGLLTAPRSGFRGSQEGLISEVTQMGRPLPDGALTASSGQAASVSHFKTPRPGPACPTPALALTRLSHTSPRPWAHFATTQIGTK